MQAVAFLRRFGAQGRGRRGHKGCRDRNPPQIAGPYSTDFIEYFSLYGNEIGLWFHHCCLAYIWRRSPAWQIRCSKAANSGSYAAGKAQAGPEFNLPPSTRTRDIQRATMPTSSIAPSNTTGNSRPTLSPANIARRVLQASGSRAAHLKMSAAWRMPQPLKKPHPEAPPQGPRRARRVRRRRRNARSSARARPSRLRPAACAPQHEGHWRRPRSTTWGMGERPDPNSLIPSSGLPREQE
ncbi:UNVERIFIED_ORG: hypothetical protein GGI57_004557 [Rhizobium aethiopicum]